MKIVLITGASSGMGAEYARQLDKEVSGIDEFWLIARRRERMEALAEELEHPVRIFAFDITEEALYEELERQLKEVQADIKILVNNAGYGIVAPVSKLSRKELSGMSEVNCGALTSMVSVCLPFMKRNARIIQMASSAAYLPQPGFAVYAATKAYVLNFSRALAEELRPQGIYVTSVCPGPVATEFFMLAEKYGTSYSFKNLFTMEADSVVREAIRASKRKQTVVTPGIAMKGFRVLTKAVPHEVILRVLRHMK